MKTQKTFFFKGLTEKLNITTSFRGKKNSHFCIKKNTSRLGKQHLGSENWCCILKTFSDARQNEIKVL